MTARIGKDPGELYRDLTAKYGDPVYERVDAPATAAQKKVLANLSPSDVTATDLAGEKITHMLTAAPGDGQPIGGLKVIAANGWFAARPSGTEEIYKIYAESFNGREHLQRIMAEAQQIVGATFAAKA
jgi:phosphoglucomutase